MPSSTTRDGLGLKDRKLADPILRLPYRHQRLVHSPVTGEPEDVSTDAAWHKYDTTSNHPAELAAEAFDLNTAQRDTSITAQA